MQYHLIHLFIVHLSPRTRTYFFLLTACDDKRCLHPEYPKLSTTNVWMFNIFSLFSPALSRAISVGVLLAKLFDACFIFALKIVFLNLLHSVVVIKPVILCILFSISLAFVYEEVLVAILIMPDIYLQILSLLY